MASAGKAEEAPRAPWEKYERAPRDPNSTSKPGEAEEVAELETIHARFVSEDGTPAGIGDLQVPATAGTAQLLALLRHILRGDLEARQQALHSHEDVDRETRLAERLTPEQLEDKLAEIDAQPFALYVAQHEVAGGLSVGTVAAQAQEDGKLSSVGEDTVEILYQPQSLFRVAAVSRCSESLAGHGDAVLCVQFAPDGSTLATGGGDREVRLWDVHTATPMATLKGHANWVLYVSWSPDGKKLASGGMDKTIRVWHPTSGKQLGKPLTGHTKYVTAISWEPLHRNPQCRRLVSASKDGRVKVWDTVLSKCVVSMSGHAHSVTCVRWGATGCIYSGSQDKTVKVWDDGSSNPANFGIQIAVLKNHAHWVNSVSLNTDYALRVGCFNERGCVSVSAAEAPGRQARRDNTVDLTLSETSETQRQKAAQAKMDLVLAASGGVELLASASDDFTLFLWQPLKDARKPIARLIGHQQVVNHVSFSPDGRWLTSASFDRSIKLWNGLTGEFVTTFRGHVEAVYQCVWSPDSRMLCSASKDSTLKLWDPRKQAAKGTSGKKQARGMRLDLPGHADEVYAVDWSPDGVRVASGSKDKLVKIWRN
jgi:ribosome assembly protein 4